VARHVAPLYDGPYPPGWAGGERSFYVIDSPRGRVAVSEYADAKRVALALHSPLSEACVCICHRRFQRRYYPSPGSCSDKCRAARYRAAQEEKGRAALGGRATAKVARALAADDPAGLSTRDLAALASPGRRGVAHGPRVTAALQVWALRDGVYSLCPLCLQRDCTGSIGPDWPCDAQRDLWGRPVLVSTRGVRDLDRDDRPGAAEEREVRAVDARQQQIAARLKL